MDDIRRNYFPGLAFEVFPAVAAIVADTEPCFKNVTVVAA